MSELIYFNFLKKNNISLILPLVIIFSSLKIKGYVVFFLFVFLYLMLTRRKFFKFSSLKSIDEKLVFSYFIFLILESVHGAIQISDYRVIIYWIPLFIVTIYLYLKNTFDIRNNYFLKRNYYKIIFLSSLFYFAFYFIMNFFSYLKYQNPFEIQSLNWMGTSGAFNISSLFFLSIFKLWSSNNFNILSKYILIIPFYLTLQAINDSRLALLYFFCFIFFVLIKNLQTKNFLNFIFLIIITLSSFTISGNLVNQINTKYSNIDKANIKDTNLIKEIDEFKVPDGRKFEFNVGIKHFKNTSFIQKFFGTGWYSSRITSVPTRNEAIDFLDQVPIKERRARYSKGEFQYIPIDLKKSEVYSLQGLIAILLDTGIIGLAFFLILISRNFYLIMRNRYDDNISKLFLFSILSIHLLCLYIGYPLVSIPYLLFILPRGLILTNNSY